MAVNINSFKLLSEALSNKSQQGGTLTITQFNEFCNRAQFTLFERDFQTFLATEKVSEFLKTFFKNQVTSVSSAGEIPYPSDFQHLASLRKYFIKPNGQGKMIQIKELNNVGYGLAQMSQLQEPTLRFPKYSEFSSVIRFLPKNLGVIEMDYFRTPVAPVWNYTVANGRPVYSSSGSVNFEWDQFAENEVMGIFLSLIGINLREGDLIAWSAQYRQENNSVL